MEAGSEVNVEVICQELRKNLELKREEALGVGGKILIIIDPFHPDGDGGTRLCLLQVVKSVSKVKCSTI